jgi:hypothetical protein
VEKPKLRHPEAIEVFFSYSHKDENLRDQLEDHLSILKRHAAIGGWHDRKISAGTERNKGESLSKQQLEELDRRFLARGERKPDAELVRWVLRASRLHPQGRVVR